MNKNICLVNIDNNVCENVVVWSGDNKDWTLPSNFIALEKETTPAKIWVLNLDKGIYELVEVIGLGDIGFTWDGSHLITNNSQPTFLQNHQPKTSGSQTL